MCDEKEGNTLNCLEKLRRGEKLTQSEMAQRLGVSASFYAKIEVGTRMPSRDFLIKVKECFPMCDMNIFFAELLHESCSGA
ncbi:MAG: helix-turn-helix transcriptional regulator [Butyrivibrio crossotus]|nr:helix-turn-helix transcriptional regulator [Butyrivibrio crossotus]